MLGFKRVAIVIGNAPKTRGATTCCLGVVVGGGKKGVTHGLSVDKLAAVVDAATRLVLSGAEFTICVGVVSDKPVTDVETAMACDVGCVGCETKMYLSCSSIWPSLFSPVVFVLVSKR